MHISVILRLSAILLVFLFTFFTLITQNPVASPLMPPAVLQQIDALLQEKQLRTPSEQKLSSQIVYALKKRNRVITVEPALELEKDGRLLVDIKASVNGDLLRTIADLGGTVLNSHPEYDAVRATLPLEATEKLAGRPDVFKIRLADRAVTDSEPMQAGKQNTSEGDLAHRAAEARAKFGVSGKGVKVGVLSDSVDFLKQVQATGDLPSQIHILPGQGATGAGLRGEGTAMMEIIHDLAPDAELYFATAFNGQASFASNIIALRQAGCDIIVDDVRYLSEPPFEDGIIARAVEQVVADGALYFASAGNAGNRNDSTSGVWEGDFKDGGSFKLLSGGTVHDFGNGDTFIEATASSTALTLFWSDQFGKSANDYDLFILNSSLTRVLRASTDVQNGDDDPFEIISGSSPVLSDTDRIVILRKNGAEARFLHLSTNRGRLRGGTEGQGRGHSCAAGAMAVAAVNVATAGNSFFKGGAANPVETFSSDGPRRVFYNLDGTAITPHDFSATGGTVRPKQDIAAADGTSCATPGFTRFFGTSAAAPHAAAIAALVKSADPSLSNAQIRELMMSTALDIEEAGFDRDSGAGIVSPLLALEAIFPAPRLSETTLVFTGQPEGSESLPQNVTLSNIGSVPLQIEALEVTDGFKVATTCGENLPAGETCTLSVTFAPSSKGLTTGSIRLLDNGPGRGRTIQLIGTTETSDFLLTPATTELSVSPREKGTLQISILRLGNLQGELRFSTSKLNGIKIAPAVNTPDQATFTFKVKATAPTGSQQLLVTASDPAGRSRTSTVIFSVR